MILELILSCVVYRFEGLWVMLFFLSWPCPLILCFTDLMILGGLELCVSQYLCHTQSGLRWHAAQLIASCAQNMPQVQVHLLSIGTLPKLLQLIESDPNSTVRVKALYAISCEYPRVLAHRWSFTVLSRRLNWFIICVLAGSVYPTHLNKTCHVLI